MSTRPTVLLFYNDFWGRYPDVDAQQAAVPCCVTTDRGELDRADGVVFHLPTLAPTDLDRIEKRPSQQWIAFSMESDVSVPLLRDRDRMARFDLRVTYERDADVWMPYAGAGSLQALLSPPKAKTAAFPVAHFQSNPYDRSGRNRYVAELIRRIKVASYGTVLPTVPEAGTLATRDDRIAMSSRHKFTLAFENSIARDYVTDKFFDALIAGSVPVYLGAPNVADFAPSPGSYIDVADFDGPADLADHLTALDLDDAAYEAHLAWKERPDPSFLAMLESVHPHGFCRVAELVHERQRGIPTSP